MRKFYPSEIEYWKAHDLFLRHHPVGALDYSFPVYVYRDIFHKREEIHVVQPYFNSAGQWSLNTAVYTETELEQWNYYRFWGVLDGSDYLTGDEDKAENVDEFILARTEEEARQLAGYPSAGAHWHWGPNLSLYDSYDDHVVVMAARFDAKVMDADITWMLKKHWEAAEAEEASRPDRETWRDEED